MKRTLTLIALLVLSTLPSFAATRGDVLLRPVYSYFSTEEIPGTAEEVCGSPCEPCTVSSLDDTRQHSFGAEFDYALRPTIRLVGGVLMPKGNPGSANLSFGGGMDFHFGYLYLPTRLNYRNDLDSIAASGGVGFEVPLGKVMSVRVQGTSDYFLDSDLTDRTGWSALAGVAFKVGNNEKACRQGCEPGYPCRCP